MSLNLINILRSGLRNLSLLVPREAPLGSRVSPSSQTANPLGSSFQGSESLGLAGELGFLGVLY